MLLKFYIILIIIICYISTFLGTQSALQGGGGGSPHPPPVCSIHLDHVTAAIVLVERRQSDEANQCMGMIRWPYCSVCVCVSQS